MIFKTKNFPRVYSIKIKIREFKFLLKTIFYFYIIKTPQNLINNFLKNSILHSRLRKKDINNYTPKKNYIFSDNDWFFEKLPLFIEYFNKNQISRNVVKKVLEIKPNFADTIWNISKIQLVNGNFNEGWKSYEWRKKTSSLGKNYKTYNKDINWLGDKDLNNKTILISYEQGLGDYLLYARYLPMIKKLGAKIILDTPKFIKPMIDSMNFDYTHTEELKKIDFDFHCSIASLPCAFKTSVETIPCKIPYLFTPKEKKEFWKKEFEDNSNIKIGLKWAGNKLHQDDRKRSMPLKKFKPLFDLPYDFHSLEIEYNKDDEKLLNEIPNLNCHKNQIPGLDNTAGLMESMDLVITVDTGINHLCGAIGKPFWILLSHVPDFRWFLDCNNSPWFPTAKLYRQTSRGDWDAVINRIKKDLLSLKNIRSN